MSHSRWSIANGLHITFLYHRILMCAQFDVRANDLYAINVSDVQNEVIIIINNSSLFWGLNIEHILQIHIVFVLCTIT